MFFSERVHFHTVAFVFSSCVWLNESSKQQHARSHFIVWIFSPVYFQMCPQSVCPGGSKFTMVTFVWLFSTVGFQMSLQSACQRGCKVTLVAFVWLFSTVHFKMTSQAAFHRGCILTLVALFSFIICVFQGNIYIIPTFTNVVIFYILIHDQRVVNVVPWVMSISNWENEDCGLEERTNESERQRCKKRQICQIYLCYFLELTFELSMQAPVLVYCSAISTIPIGTTPCTNATSTNDMVVWPATKLAFALPDLSKFDGVDSMMVVWPTTKLAFALPDFSKFDRVDFMMVVWPTTKLAFALPVFQNLTE